METSYGIVVKNKYAIFIGDDEEDPLELVSKTADKAKTEKTADKKNAVKALNDSKLSNANHQNIIKDNKTQKDSIKSKTADGPQSKPKDVAPKGDSNRPPRVKTDRDRNQRNRELNQSADKTNHINDRQNRPPRQSTDQKEIDDLKNQRNRDDRFGNSGEIREKRERSDSDRRGGRNGRNNSSRRGGQRFGDDRRGKRDLDRHSGSDKAGVKAVDKREGGGAHNWGKINDFGTETEPFAGEANELDRSADETAPDVTDANQENDANISDEQKDVAEEPKVMTLEEYKQQLEEKRVHSNFNLRKPGEGEDTSQWKKTFVLKKKVEDEEEVEYEEIEVEETPKGRHKQVLDIEINFRDEGRDFARRGDGRRGGRGRDGGDRRERPDRRDRPDKGGDRREGPPNRGPRTDRPFGDRNRTRRPRDAKEQTAPKVDDWNDFPSLAAA